MPGKIITVASSKGGAGKTLLVCTLAPNLAARGYKVGVIDSDPNGTFSAWVRGYDGAPFKHAEEVRDVALVDLAQEWSADLDVVLVDTAGFGNLSAAAAMGTADYILVPCMPDRGSTREAAKTMQKAASLAKAARRDIPASIVLSQWRKGGVAEKAASSDLEDYEVGSVLTTVIPDRVAMRQLSFDSRTLTGGQLGTMIDALIGELVEKGALDPLASVLNKTRRKRFIPTINS